MAWLVAGLGNPGDRYARTRHNLGRLVVDELARAAEARLRKVRFLPAEAVEIRVDGQRVWLVRSTLYMNESGPSYASVARKHGIAPDHVIAVHDEIDLPAGELRVRFDGGTAGHNGLRSLQAALRTPGFLRVRLGVGRPPGRQDPARYVLEPIPAQLAADVALLLDRGAEAVRSLVLNGLETTQARFNRRGPR